MAFSLHLDAGRPCTNDLGYHEGYAYYLDDKGDVHVQEMSREWAAGRNMLRLMDAAQRLIDGNILSAVAVVRMCEAHDTVRREHVRTFALTRVGVVKTVLEQELHVDATTGIGTFSSVMGDGPLAVLPYVPNPRQPLHIALALAPPGYNFYIAQQQGAVIEPDYVRLAPKP